jgi:hypothetical protein
VVVKILEGSAGAGHQRSALPLELASIGTPVAIQRLTVRTISCIVYPCIILTDELDGVAVARLQEFLAALQGDHRDYLSCIKHRGFLWCIPLIDPVVVALRSWRPSTHL